MTPRARTKVTELSLEVERELRRSIDQADRGETIELTAEELDEACKTEMTFIEELEGRRVVSAYARRINAAFAPGTLPPLPRGKGRGWGLCEEVVPSPRPNRRHAFLPTNLSFGAIRHEVKRTDCAAFPADRVDPCPFM